jgi:hypothetical protein
MNTRKHPNAQKLHWDAFYRLSAQLLVIKHQERYESKFSAAQRGKVVLTDYIAHS